MRRLLRWGWLISGSRRPRLECAAEEIKGWRQPLQRDNGSDHQADRAGLTTPAFDQQSQLNGTKSAPSPLWRMYQQEVEAE
jgi:hypothetical protein